MHNEEARRVVRTLTAEFEIVELDENVRCAASKLAEQRRLQFYDAQIIAALTSTNSRSVLSEDMQDGALLDGIPF